LTFWLPLRYIDIAASSVVISYASARKLGAVARLENRSRRSRYATSHGAGIPSSRLTAQWRCQKNPSRSGSGLTARCMRSSHSITSSSSDASGSIG
jgi:hypothetical protein